MNFKFLIFLLVCFSNISSYCQTTKECTDSRSIENVNPSTYGISDISKLKPVNYIVKSTGDVQLGLIAQEVQKAIPEAVKISDGDMLNVSYSSLVAILVNVVKEQQRLIDMQKADIIDIRGQLDDIRRSSK